jgi:hypothetical protein
MKEKATGGSQYEKNGKSHYQRNHDYYISRNRDRRRFLQDYLREIKEKSGCVDCGIKDFRVLDFDHIGDKTIEPARMANNLWSIERINKELEQCEVRCANCHRIVTWERRQASVVSVDST